MTPEILIPDEFKPKILIPDEFKPMKRSADQIGKIERPQGKSVYMIAGTRIPVIAVKRFARTGYSTEQIIKEYPDLTLEDVDAALKFTFPKAQKPRYDAVYWDGVAWLDNL